MSRAVIQPFEEYQRARVIFVQTVAALAGGKDNRNVELLKRLDAIRLLGPLLTDPVISIKQYAALAIGTLAGADEEIASQVVNDDNGHILNLILKSLETSNRFYKKTACRLLGKLSKWKSLAAKVVSGGVITFLVSCLEDCDGEVKLFAASALQKICMNGEDLAREVINAGAIEPLSLCLQEPDIKLKRQSHDGMHYIIPINQAKNLNFDFMDKYSTNNRRGDPNVLFKPDANIIVYSPVG